MELIQVGKNRYLVKNSNKIVSKEEVMADEDSTVKKAKQTKRTNRKSKRTRD